MSAYMSTINAAGAGYYYVLVISCEMVIWLSAFTLDMWGLRGNVKTFCFVGLQILNSGGIQPTQLKKLTLPNSPEQLPDSDTVSTLYHNITLGSSFFKK